MITLKTPLTYKHYFLGNLYRKLDGVWERAFLILFIVFFIFFIWHKFYYWSLIVIFIPLLFYFFIPLVKWIYAKKYHRMHFMEYFFGDDSIGYSIGGYKMEVEKSKIKSIQVKINCFVIKLDRNELYFMGEKEDISRVKKEILESNYKEYMKDRN